jgi:hypothetical protein
MYTLQPTLRSLRKAGHGCRPDVVYAACQHRSGRLVARQRHDNPMVIPERPPGKGIPIDLSCRQTRSNTSASSSHDSRSEGVQAGARLRCVRGTVRPRLPKPRHDRVTCRRVAVG